MILSSTPKKTQFFGIAHAQVIRPQCLLTCLVKESRFLLQPDGSILSYCLVFLMVWMCLLCICITD